MWRKTELEKGDTASPLPLPAYTVLVGSNLYIRILLACVSLTNLLY